MLRSNQLSYITASEIIARTCINPILGRMTALRGARNPHARKCIPVSCAPGALSCIPVIEFLKVRGRIKSPLYALAVFKDGFALVDKGVHAFLLVFGGKHGVKQPALEHHAVA